MSAPISVEIGFGATGALLAVVCVLLLPRETKDVLRTQAITRGVWFAFVGMLFAVLLFNFGPSLPRFGELFFYFMFGFTGVAAVWTKSEELSRITLVEHRNVQSVEENHKRRAIDQYRRKHGS